MKPVLPLILLLLAQVLLPFSGVRAQPFDSLLTRLDSQFPQEKVYLHLDKQAYNPGETIWMKAYLITGNNASGISKNLYAELFDQGGKLLQRKILPVIYSGAFGGFDLPASLKDSVLHIRAYTKWMLNFDSAFLYSRTIAILNEKQATAKKAPASSTSSLQFFPEGGDLVEGLESVVAFKATDNRGLPITISGSILNAKGETISALVTDHDGMGRFLLKPGPGQPYKAIWKEPGGKLKQTVLPAAKETGMVLSLEKTAGGISYTVKRKEDAAGEFPSVIVLAQMQQQIMYQAKVNLANSATVKATIPAEGIPTGILQVTIFSKELKPLAERIIFVNPQDYYFITDLNIASKNLAKRGKNVIQVDVPDTLICNLSLAVTDLAANPVLPGEPEIFSSLLLTGDIKGYVHNPAYYFSNETDSVARHLDLVMLTNGWRRFTWSDLLANKWPVIKHLPENYITYEGKISGLNKSELINQELTAILTLKNEGQQLLSIPVQRDGSFSVPGLFYYDTAKLYYQFANDKLKMLSTKALVDVRNNFLLQGAPFPVNPLWASRVGRPDKPVITRNQQMTVKNNEMQESQRKVQTLGGVEVVAKQKSKKEKLDEEYSSGLFKGGDGYSFIPEDDPSAVGNQTVLNYLQGKVAGLQISGFGEQMNLSWRGGKPDLYYNEMKGDIAMIQNIPMSEVALIKVFRPPFFGSQGGGSGGAIAVYSKKGASLSGEKSRGLDFARIAGYKAERQFYSPDYSNAAADNGLEDYRTTLYWNPMILTDKNNRRIYLSFYNNDVSKKIRIVIEGLNVEGKLTRIEKLVE